MEGGLDCVLSLAFAISMTDSLTPFLSVREVGWVDDRFLIESGSMGPVVWIGMGTSGGEGVHSACGAPTRFRSAGVGGNRPREARGGDGVRSRLAGADVPNCPRVRSISCSTLVALRPGLFGGSRGPVGCRLMLIALVGREGISVVLSVGIGDTGRNVE